MKKLCKRFGIIAMMAVIGFLMTGCPTDGTGNGNGTGGGNGTNGGGNGTQNGNNGFLGSTMNLSGWVYTEERTDAGRIFTRFPADENLFFSNPSFGLSGTITNGQLNLTVGRPSASYLENIGDRFDEGDSIVTISDRSAMIFAEDDLQLRDGTWLVRFYESISQDGMSGVSYWIMFVFVDRDVTVSEEYRRWTEGNDTVIFEASTFAFREGWNVINQRGEWVETDVGFRETTWTASMGDLDYPVRWVFLLYDDE